MQKQSISQSLLALLDASAGKHSLIAKQTGISQATVSRIYLRKVSPSLRIAERLMAWFEADAEKQAVCQAALQALALRKKQASEKSTLRLSNTHVSAQGAGLATATAVA
jgi:transcriptional regulator with XRE-family HTH domain